MRKARKLLSFLLLMVFVIPFVPSHVASVSGVEVMDAYLTRIRVPNGFEYTNGDEFELVVEFSGVDPDLVEEAIVYFHLDTTGVSYGLPLNYDDSLGKFTIKGAAEKILQKGKHTLWSISVFDVDGVEH